MVATEPTKLNGHGHGSGNPADKNAHTDYNDTNATESLKVRFTHLLSRKPKAPLHSDDPPEYTPNALSEPAASHTDDNAHDPPIGTYPSGHHHQTGSDSSHASHWTTLSEAMAQNAPSGDPNEYDSETEAALLRYGVGPSAVLHRNLHHEPHKVVGAKGLYMQLSNGQTILDATGGAAVSCLGHGNERIKAAIVKQADVVSYCHSLFYSTQAAEDLATALCDSTGWVMRKAYIVCSGSEAMEAAVKLARQYFVERGEPQRIRFIARKESYHGTTLGGLAVGGHVGRRAIYEPLLMENVSRVSACNAYRGIKEGETEEEYVERLKEELDQEFQRVGPDTVCAFVAEPVVGAALGCVPAVSGYFKAMKEVCDKYGALLILDEIMCGVGRTGYWHAWNAEGVVPDIQTIGKGLGGGYAPVAGILIHKRVVEALDKGTGAFSHGHTYQGHPIGCAVALEVQKILGEKNLVNNVREQGLVLEDLLEQSLGDHPNVGNIRGKGLFWGIEFVKDKATKEPFEPQQAIAMRIHEKGMEEPYSISLYPGTGTVDGKRGDHILISPAYTVTKNEISLIVEKTTKVIKDFFKGAEFASGNGSAWNHP